MAIGIREILTGKIKPPYVLLGASFGGLVAYIYAVTYPKEVTGMVLLDAAFPDELALEGCFPRTSG
jgi:pimeloyl-ACP methyl ester carboxylesterase